jgi:phosphate transport system protein
MKRSQAAARLADLPLHVVRLASLTTAAIAAASDALVGSDLAAAQRVIDDDDDAVDTLRHSIEDDCLDLLAVAKLADADLRFVVATLRVAHELERSADLMVNVAKTTWRLHDHPLDDRSRRLVERMGRQATLQLRIAVNAFADRDSSSAAALVDMDGAMDELEHTLFRHILGLEGPDEADVVRAVQLGLVARHYERVGDHAVTIAEQVHVVTTGERLPYHRRARIGVGG